MSFPVAIHKDGHIYYPVHLEFTGNIYWGKAFLSELTENTYSPNHSLTLTLMSNNSVGKKNKPRISILRECGFLSLPKDKFLSKYTYPL